MIEHADGTYTELQLRSWAHLIQMKHHSSYDTPPQFEKCHRLKKKLLPFFPGEQVNLRGQCVQQLLNLHQ